MYKSSNPKVSPYRRIIAASCHIEVKQASRYFRIVLKHSNENVAEASAPRGGGMSSGSAMEKARLNSWGRTSGFRQALDKLADIAEQQFLTKPSGNMGGEKND